jgi:hypothetical protein
MVSKISAMVMRTCLERLKVGSRKGTAFVDGAQQSPVSLYS